jgi:hypothetical protein
MKQFHEQKQFHVNVYYNSSWCLFKMRTHQQGGDDNFEDDMDYQSDPSDEGGVKINRDEDQEMMEEDRAAEREERRKYRPYKFSGKNYTFDVNHERALIDDLRSWTQNYFAKEYVITKEMYKLLKDLKGGSGDG